MKKIGFPSAKGYKFVTLGDIVRCEASRSYTYIKSIDGTIILSSKNIGHIETLINDNTFFRSHKSHIVNTKYLRELIKEEGFKLVLTNQDVIPLARDRKKHFEELFVKVKY